MPSSAYIALSGLSARTDHLDSLAADIANAGTSGYKGVKHSSVTAERPQFDQVLDSAIDMMAGPARIDFSEGTVLPTGRDLDLSIEGDGFFAVETDNGVRYTRNGHFVRMSDGTLASEDGAPLLTRSGRHLTLGPGTIRIDANGMVFAGAEPAGQIQVVRFAPDAGLAREGGARFRAPEGAAQETDDAKVRPGTLEQSNVSIFERLTQMTQTTRSFESLYRAIQTVMNDVDGRTISELGRR
jgi:flagellar basal body rod protein FlgG